MNKGKTILVVDDEKNILDIVVFNLKNEGYETVSAMDGEQAVEMQKKHNPDLILLDVMLPKMDGFAVCKAIREYSNVPIIMLTARADEVDKIMGLELGADDYITKPFSMKELSARILANTRRVPAPIAQASDFESANIIKCGEITIDCDKYEIYRKGQLLDLTYREYELMKFMATQPEKVFTREMLLEKVWGFEFYGDVRTVDVTIRRLREKIEEDPGNPVYVMTKRGVGYYFNKKN
ncbi:MAG: response regulator transcription factor [Clostridia bacterium]|nr:response regulator transcription factor [Clostridia bacterium]